MRQLTPREQQIVELVVKGLSTIEIGRQLHISEHTVFSHKQNLFKKLGVTNSVSLAMKAYVHSLVSQEKVNTYYSAGQGEDYGKTTFNQENSNADNVGMDSFSE